MIPRLAAVAAAGLLCCGAVSLGAASLGAQEGAVRFTISAVGDSTFTLALGRHRWLDVGQVGIIVDPRDRDLLVGRFRVVAVDSATATGLVTGLLTKVTNDHVALIDRPPPPPVAWYRRRTFWLGVILGVAAGFGAGSAGQ